MNTASEPEEAEPHPGYIRLQIDMQYDARSQGFFVKAPDDWASKTDAQRQRFLDEEAQTYLAEQVEAHGTYYATAEEAQAENGGGWALAFDESDVKERY